MSEWKDRTSAEIVRALRDHANVQMTGKTNKGDLVELVTYWLGPDPDEPVLLTPDKQATAIADFGRLEIPTIAEAMVRIMRQVTAIGKNQKNVDSGYSARSIDDVLDSLHDLMADAGVFVLPIVTSAEHRDVEVGSKRTIQREATLTVTFRFTGPRGDYVDAVMHGEGLDSGDKGTNKAQSAALKYCLLQTFVIPITGGLGPDADLTSPERSEARTAPEDGLLEPDEVQPYLDRIEKLGDQRENFRIALRAAVRAGRIRKWAELCLSDEPVLDALLAGFEAVGAQAAPTESTCPECGQPEPGHAEGCTMAPM